MQLHAHILHIMLHYIFVECQSLLGLANSPQNAKAETKGSSERKFRHASRGKGQRRGCQGKGQGSLFPPFLEGKGQRRGCQGKGQGSLFPPFFWPGRLRPREEEYTAAGMLIITTMKSPWRPLASLLKAICSVPYITSHPASEAV